LRVGKRIEEAHLLYCHGLNTNLYTQTCPTPCTRLRHFPPNEKHCKLPPPFKISYLCWIAPAMLATVCQSAIPTTNFRLYYQTLIPDTVTFQETDDFRIHCGLHCNNSFMVTIHSLLQRTQVTTNPKNTQLILWYPTLSPC